MKDQRIPQEPTPQVLAAPTATTPAAPTPNQVSIGAVVVTRNRLTLLQECVAALRAQTRVPDEIIIIDNASDDGTRQWLATQNDLTVILQGNVGGAGGFHRGIKEAHARGHDWFWCMDDDTIAQPETLERLCAAPPFRDPRTGFLGSLVQWTDGSIHKMNMWLSLPGGARDVHW
ncbi:MAG: glycosyltransferase, partial [Acidimicrobiales bacterium]